MTTELPPLMGPEVGVSDVTAGRGSVVVMAAAAFSLPPVRHRPERASLGSALTRMRSIRVAADSEGAMEARSATVPATYGAAIEVPLRNTHSSGTNEAIPTSSM